MYPAPSPRLAHIGIRLMMYKGYLQALGKLYS